MRKLKWDGDPFTRANLGEIPDPVKCSISHSSPTVKMANHASQTESPGPWNHHRGPIQDLPGLGVGAGGRAVMSSLPPFKTLAVIRTGSADSGPGSSWVPSGTPGSASPAPVVGGSAGQDSENTAIQGEAERAGFDQARIGKLLYRLYLRFKSSTNADFQSLDTLLSSHGF